jgi:hypothetical protein
MKKVALMIVQILLAVAAKVSLIWVCIEFILYLFKDSVFNWNSVWVFCITWTLAVLAVVAFIIYEAANMPNRKIKLKSGFQKRLQELEERRK